ncbi:P-loop containing nucleoside triphosphate hydrolase protein [Fistulina hepatica ATCC 64428]|uniref:p-loop containing nucleoside triphosphate hydrolase protein n=1 Tax=Fistulina hepatica ATCC 64428 TaxID=1128425 RepID=A0A0D7A0J3_9AGAR|nr:P-loop containing nucleoside triphosphate hydrolase protein [Fistulina hepatica ATCC 64428]
MEGESTGIVQVTNLTYTHLNAQEPSLLDVTLDLPRGSRTIIVGANGAGKSTLLQILAGKHMVKDARVTIKGKDVFREVQEGVAFLGTEWAMNPIVRRDILVSSFLDSVGGYRHKERRDKLLDILDIDLDWHMHEISDGERRRVQLCFGLMGDWDVLLLDEVTVDLDVLVRDDLLKFLVRDSDERGATILYATHIFDGLSDFPTHIAHMRLGAFLTPPTPRDLLHNGASRPAKGLSDVSGTAVGRPFSELSLYNIALDWLRADRAYRHELEQRHGKKMRGARRDQAVPSDSETFYRKYDYGH